MPSYREGLPKSLIEGAAVGLPLVTTNTIGCRDVVVNGLNGYLVPLKDSENLALAIEKLIRNEDLRTKMGKESFKLVISKFSAKIINSHTISIYNELWLCFSFLVIERKPASRVQHKRLILPSKYVMSNIWMNKKLANDIIQAFSVKQK